MPRNRFSNAPPKHAMRLCSRLQCLILTSNGQNNHCVCLHMLKIFCCLKLAFGMYVTNTDGGASSHCVHFRGGPNYCFPTPALPTQSSFDFYLKFVSHIVIPRPGSRQAREYLLQMMSGSRVASQIFLVFSAVSVRTTESSAVHATELARNLATNCFSRH